MHIQNRHHFIGIFALYSTCLYLTFPRSNIFQFLHSYQFLYWFSFHNQSGDICFCAVRHDICQSNRAHHDLDLVGSSFCMIPPLNSQCLLRSKTPSAWLTARPDQLPFLHRYLDASRLGLVLRRTASQALSSLDYKRLRHNKISLAIILIILLSPRYFHLCMFFSELRLYMWSHVQNR